MSGNKDSTPNAPRYVIAFRGTITLEDLKLNLYCILNKLHRTFHFERAMQAVTNMVASGGDLNIWLAGHSLGSAMALLAGKNMAKSGIFLDTFLFNPPYFSAPIEKIKDKKVKDTIRIASSFIKAGLATAKPALIKSYQQRPRSEDPFVLLSPWVPHLFVNPGDILCAEYIGYFERRKKMEEIGAGSIERLATQNSLGGLFLPGIGKEAEEPLHLLPSANLTVNLRESADLIKAHGIQQWLKPDMHLHSKLYQL